MNNFDSPLSIHSSLSHSFEDIYSYINAIPALFWKIDLIKNKIEYLNRYIIPGLGDNSTLIIKNPEFTHSIILKEDKHIFDGFLRCIKEHKSATAVFRIKLFDGTIKWIKIAGNQDIYHSSCYVGYIMDITETANFIRSIDNSQSSMAKKINLFPNPVALFSFNDKKMIACNSAFEKIFLLSSNQEYNLSNFIDENSEKYLILIYEELIFSGKWRGELSFKSPDNNRFLADAMIRPLHTEGKNLLWISIYNISDTKPITPEKIKEYQIKDPDLKKINKEAQSAAKKKNLKKLLEIMLNNQPIENLATAILYSDIHINDGKVIVWGAGSAFDTLTPGYTHPFEGTIAENILNYKLNHIIVENTLESIKPVDWAIFIPCGIRSYFAKPFFEQGELKTVLIFCSTEPSVFTEDNIKLYDPLLSIFIKNLMLIKK
jgi:hypothetical protein